MFQSETENRGQCPSPWPKKRKSPAVGHADRLIRAARKMSEDLDPILFSEPVTHVYNPLRHAARGYRKYLRRFGDSRKRVVFLGMNPGPYGMTQTGVPFGEVSFVRDWMGIHERIDRPVPEHPKRPVDGFDCTRSEVSGARVWGTISRHWGTPEAFFRDHFIANYCPLVFMEDSGKNRTPDKLPAAEREPLYKACNTHLRRLVQILDPEWVIGIGAFAEKRAQEVLADLDLQFGRVLHPSPASPKANRDWAGEAESELRALGLCENQLSSPPMGPKKD
jgi:single-strand selective monofunctional uracil DNA glycosylase